MEQFNESENDSIAYKKAKDKIKEIKGFYYNIACYSVTIPILIYINLKYVPEFHWFWFSIVGWGTGVIIQGMFAFGWVPFLGKDWESRKLKEFMEKDQAM
ncbi:MAG: 2TM domain-containing protein [Bacteroidota bacterium]